MFGEQGLVIVTGVLAALVSVMQELVRRAALQDGHFQGLLGQFMRHVFIHGLTDHPRRLGALSCIIMPRIFGHVTSCRWSTSTFASTSCSSLSNWPPDAWSTSG